MKLFRYFVLVIVGALLLGVFKVDITGFVISEPGFEATQNVAENGSISVYFCQVDNCENAFLEVIEIAKDTLYCAFFELENDAMINALAQKSSDVDVRLILDEEMYEKQIYGEAIRFEKSSAFMHNKFCVGDEQFVVTGSTNPTENGFEYNDNNVVVLESKYLAKNYQSEFMEMWYGDFGEGQNVEYTNVELSGMHIENLFCPEDHCEDRVLDVLSTAQESIYFMTFSFTSDPIEEELINCYERGVDVKGVFEKRSKSKYLAYDGLEAVGADVRWDTNGKTMHHKVFIVDEKIVVTGSYNPSNRGNKINDENVLIIYDETVAQEFLNEFHRVYFEQEVHKS